MLPLEKQTYIRCDCGVPDHNLVIRTRDDDEFPILLVDMQVEVGSFWDRLKKALSYLFGDHNKDYGHWHEVVIRGQNVALMYNHLHEYLIASVSRPVTDQPALDGPGTVKRYFFEPRWEGVGPLRPGEVIDGTFGRWIVRATSTGITLTEISEAGGDGDA